jgi:hypothetical protein
MSQPFDITSIIDNTKYNIFTNGKIFFMCRTDKNTASLIGNFFIQDVSFENTELFIPPTSNSFGNIIYSTTTPNLVSLSGFQINAIGAGPANVVATQDACGQFTSSSTIAYFHIDPIPPTLGSFSINDMSFDTTQTIIDPSSNSYGSFEYDTSNTNISIHNNIISTSKIGLATVMTFQDACGNYTISSPLYASFNVFPVPSTITSFIIPNVSYGQISYITDPNSNSDGQLHYLTFSENITLSGNEILTLNVGQPTVIVNQDASGNYLQGTSATSFTVDPIYPMITAYIHNVSYGFGPFDISGDITSNSTGTIAYTSRNTQIATVSGSIVTIGNVGIGNILITQSASGNYIIGNLSTTFVIDPIPPTISFSTLPTVSYGTSPFDLSGYVQSNSTGAFSYTSGNTLVASLSGSLLTAGNVGTVSISVIQTASGNYTIGNAYSSLVVHSIPSTITAILPNVSFGIGIYDISGYVHSNSTGAFSYTSGNTLVATVSGSIVTIGNVGTGNILITQSASGNYSVGNLSSTFVVNPKMPTITFSRPLPNVFYGASPYDISGYVQSNSTGTFSYTSGNTLVATVSGSVVTIGNLGTGNIIVTQSASGNYTIGTTFSTFIVNANLTTITFSALPNVSFGIGPYDISGYVTSNSKGALSYTSGNTLVATISGSIITIGNVGIDNIIVTQSASGTYGTATAFSSFVVNQGIPNITAKIPNVSFGIGPYDISGYVTSNSLGAITYTSGNTMVASLSGSIVTIANLGIGNILISQSATNNFTAGNVYSTFSVDPTVYTVRVYNWHGNTPSLFNVSGTSMQNQNIVSVDMGTGHAIACDVNGHVYTWGSNGTGQLGIGTNDANNQNTPTQLSLSGKIVAVAAGNDYTTTSPTTIYDQQGCSFALDNSGRLYSWGGNTWGQLGNGLTTDNYTPTLIPTTGTPMQNAFIQSIVVGSLRGNGYYTTACALDSSGKVYTWGYGGYGSLGNNTTNNSSVPVLVQFSTPIPTIRRIFTTKTAQGSASFWAIDTSGNCWAWGGNNNGTIGDLNTTNTSRVLLPINITNISQSILYQKQITFVCTYGTLGTCFLDANSNLYVLAPTTINVQVNLAVLNGYSINCLSIDSSGVIYTVTNNNQVYSITNPTTSPVITLINTWPIGNYQNIAFD